MSAPKLADLQSWFKARMRGESFAGQSVKFNPQAGEPGENRVAVYADGYHARMFEALSEMYEAARFLMGDSRFGEMVARYSEQYPSKSYNLSDAGKHLPEFLRETHMDVAGTPCLIDLSVLERLVSRAFHARNEKPLSSETLAEIPAAQLANSIFKFQPFIGLVRSQWAILDIWRRRHEPREELDPTLLTESKPQNVWVVRMGVSVQCRLLENWQAVLMDALLAGCTLTDACEAINEELEDPTQLTVFLSGIVTEGFIAGVTPGEITSA